MGCINPCCLLRVHSMVDVVDRATRSRMMSAIRGRDTTPEVIVRKYLFAHGFRYRIAPRNLPGRPDIVLPKHRAVIFVHGCFWHRHPGCRYAATPATRPEFWRHKFRENVVRDKRVRHLLGVEGWRVLVIWECEVSIASKLRKLRRQLATGAPKPAKAQ